MNEEGSLASQYVTPGCEDEQLAELVGLFVELRRGAPGLSADTFVACCPESVDRARLRGVLRTIDFLSAAPGGAHAQLADELLTGRGPACGTEMDTWVEVR